MSKDNLLDNSRMIVAADVASAATTTINGSVVVDTAGFQRVLWAVILGDVTSGSVMSLQIQDNTGNSTTGMTDITGAQAGKTAGASDCDLKIIAVDVKVGKRRYQRPVFTRGTQNAVVNGIIAICYNGDKCPYNLAGDVVAQANALAA